MSWSDGSSRATGVAGTGVAPIDPRLAPLAKNGGPTRTHALQAGSPALDAGDVESTLDTDQRGFPRSSRERANESDRRE